jgi:hypothetical protein
VYGRVPTRESAALAGRVSALARGVLVGDVIGRCYRADADRSMLGNRSRSVESLDQRLLEMVRVLAVNRMAAVDAVLAGGGEARLHGLVADIEKLESLESAIERLRLQDERVADCVSPSLAIRPRRAHSTCDAQRNVCDTF